MPKPKDLSPLIGKQFGEWTIIRLDDGTGIKGRKAFCHCSCGTEDWVLVVNLTRNLSTKCRNHERLSRRKMAIPLKNLPEYHIWAGIRNRCFNRREPSYHRYGGRGIVVCERWQGPDGFAHFLADMGARPSENHSIERKNNHGPYSPENCVWSTPAEQANNTRSNTVWTFQGRSMTIAQWGRFLGVNSHTLRNRVGFLGWTVEQALTRPIRHLRRRLPSLND